MAILPIRTFGDPVLRQRTRDIESVTDLHRRLIDDMIDTMRDAPGVGLAAPQVGVMERIFVWEVDNRYGAVINPKVVARSADMVTDEEGCLSLPGLAYPVERHHGVRVEGLDEEGNGISIEATDLLARVFQHETDHLDGVLFIDRLPEQLRGEAMRILREQSLGLPPLPETIGSAGGPLPREERL